MQKLLAFTIIEMLASLAILIILCAISLPVMHHFISHTQDEILQKQLLRAIETAKREARAHHAPVVLCQSNNQQVCKGNWEDGQLIFVNEQADGIVHDSESILAVQQTQSQHGRIHWRAFPGYRNYLLFLPGGLLQNDNGTFWHCHAAAPLWAIMLSKSGRTRVVTPNKNGEIRDSQGHRLSC